MPPPPKAPVDPVAERLRGRLMQQSLRRLLDRVRGARDVLPHLAALETSLGKHGPEVIATITRPALARICSQLSSLPLPEDDPPLHDLLTRLMDRLEAQRVAQEEVSPYRSTFIGERTLVIEEASHSDFMQAANAQATTVRAEFMDLPDWSVGTVRGQP